MLEFHPITLEDKPRADAILFSADNMGCEYSFGTLFVWRKVYKTEIAFWGDMLVAKYHTPSGYSYCCPVGKGDFKQMLGLVLLDAQRHSAKAIIGACSENDKARIEQAYPEKFTFEADDSRFDYIYSRDNLAELKGKKYHGKRNHISFFEKNNPDWRFEFINKDNIGQCAAMNELWLKENEHKDEQEISAEHNALNEAMANFEELGLVGGLIRADNRVVAFSIGEMIKEDMFCTHFEKAFAAVRGAYPIINREMARNVATDCVYINREEDTGDEGLRKAKQSYYPAVWLTKYTASCEVE